MKQLMLKSKNLLFFFLNFIYFRLSYAKHLFELIEIIGTEGIKNLGKILNLMVNLFFYFDFFINRLMNLTRLN